MKACKSIEISAASAGLEDLIRDDVSKGVTVLLTDNAKPIAKLVAFDSIQPSRVGFMKGRIKLPDAEQFDRLGERDIEAMFKLAE